MMDDSKRGKKTEKGEDGDRIILDWGLMKEARSEPNLKQIICDLEKNRNIIKTCMHYETLHNTNLISKKIRH